MSYAVPPLSRLIPSYLSNSPTKATVGIEKSSNNESSPPSDPHPRVFRQMRNFSETYLQNDLYPMETRPTFGRWLKITWPDLLTMVIIGAIALTTFRFGPPIAHRTFPLTVRIADNSTDPTPGTHEVVYPQFAYPDRRQIISSGIDTIVCIAVPTLFICLSQIRIRSFWDANNAILGLTYALLTASAFQVMIKWTVGGLRPNFYDTCKPDVNRALSGEHNKTGLNGVGYHQYMWTVEICSAGSRGAIRNAMQSFPSGHSTTITAAGVYLFLYLNAKLKIFANYHSAMWKLVLLFCPLLGAVIVCGALTIDQTHNWYDILAGATIGAVFALSSYRMVYASLFDWRFNHIPLNRYSAFAGPNGYERCERPDLVWTSSAGWRDGVAQQRDDSPLPPPVTSNESTGPAYTMPADRTVKDDNIQDNIASSSRGST